MQFFHAVSATEARRILERPAPPLEAQHLPCAEAVGRVAAADLLAPCDLPEFPRAVVDGFAVRAADTFGASAAQPAYLPLAGEVAMGRPPPAPLPPGACMRIATGGMLPEGADAVVMVEHAQAAGADLVEVFSTVAPGEGLVRAGDDARAGDVLVPRGRRLRPQEIGALAAAGVTRVEVYRLPRVAILPTGDEIVPPEHPPGPGQVRDVNSALLAAALRECGAAPLPYPILPDNPDALRAAATDALAHADMLLVAGGSSVGARDWTLDVLTSLPGARLLFHGAAIRPGKPVLAVALGDRLMVGLPGNPLSALIVFRQLLRPYLARLAGETHAAHLRPRLAARLAASYASEPGKEDYVRVRLVPGQEGLRATPLPGKSALLRTLLEADGIVVVPDAVEGLEAGDSVEVEPL